MIRNISDLQTWDQYQQKTNPISFLQSRAWGELNKLLQNSVFYLSLENDQGKVVSVCLATKYEAKRANYLLIPHGPLFLNLNNSTQSNVKSNLKFREDILLNWLEYFRELAKKQNCSFIRWQPGLVDNTKNQNLLSLLPVKKAPIHAHTELTTVVDLKKTPNELLMSMRKTTRQMIRKALKLEKKGDLKIKNSQVITSKMHQIYLDTYKRGGAIPFSKDFVEKEWKAFYDQNQAELFCVYYQEKLMSWGMVIFFGDKAFYHQGANILDKKIPAPFFLHYKAMLKAQQKNCKTYDFWGVAPKDQPNHPWKNISFFKRGFGGEDVSYLPAQDLVVNPILYWPNWLLENYRAWKRGFKG